MFPPKKFKYCLSLETYCFHWIFLFRGTIAPLACIRGTQALVSLATSFVYLSPIYWACLLSKTWIKSHLNPKPSQHPPAKISISFFRVHSAVVCLVVWLYGDSIHLKTEIWFWIYLWFKIKSCLLNSLKVFLTCLW